MFGKFNWLDESVGDDIESLLEDLMRYEEGLGIGFVRSKTLSHLQDALGSIQTRPARFFKRLPEIQRDNRSILQTLGIGLIELSNDAGDAAAESVIQEIAEELGEPPDSLQFRASPLFVFNKIGFTITDQQQFLSFLRQFSQGQQHISQENRVFLFIRWVIESIEYQFEMYYFLNSHRGIRDVLTIFPLIPELVHFIETYGIIDANLQSYQKHIEQSTVREYAELISRGYDVEKPVAIQLPDREKMQQSSFEFFMNQMRPFARILHEMRDPRVVPLADKVREYVVAVLERCAEVFSPEQCTQLAQLFQSRDKI